MASGFSETLIPHFCPRLELICSCTVEMLVPMCDLWLKRSWATARVVDPSVGYGSTASGAMCCCLGHACRTTQQSPSQRLSQFRYRKEEERTLDFTSGIQNAPEYCVCLLLLEKPCLLGSPSNLSSSMLGTERLLPNSLPYGMRETPSVALLLSLSLSLPFWLAPVSPKDGRGKTTTPNHHG